MANLLSFSATEIKAQLPAWWIFFMDDWDLIDWDDLVHRLALYAHYRATDLTWRGSPSGPMPGGKEPKDIVYDAIQKTIAKERNWNPGKRSLYHHLKDVIDSMLNHRAMSLENRATRRYDSSIVQIQDYSPTQEEILLTNSEIKNFLGFLKAKDELVYEIANTIFNTGFLKNYEISEEMNLSIREVENRKKRLRRLVSAYLSQEKRYAQ